MPQLGRLRFELVSRERSALWNEYIDRYHYLGYTPLSAARLPADWELRYGIRPWLLESFVDRSRFEGTCYRAANWIDVGQTQGRGKKDRSIMRMEPACTAQ